MSERTVGIRDLKAHLSKYLQRVRQGQALLITDRGRPIGRILPVDIPLEEKIEAAIEAGILAWNGEPYPAGEPVARARGGKTVAELVIEDRE